ncbi:MAG: YfhO family protein [Bacilli bacterium]|nr:YfhO family protein [Bacilli bacterium]
MKYLKKILSNKLYVLTFIISCAIIGILYKLNNVTPFGTNSLLCVDFYHQYGPMLAEFYDRIKSCEGLVYSFNMASGLPIFRNLLNYLSSPFNVIMFLFPRNLLITSYSYIIGLKAVASSVTMVYYLSKKFNTKSSILIPMGIIYAFQAYFSAYYWNIMWLDGMVFLPLITLGIENIVNKKKWKLYTFSLAIMLLANYFIGYMICIYSVLYFIFYNLYKTKFSIKNWKFVTKDTLIKCFMFGTSSLLAGMLGAFLLLPMASSMQSISATGGTFPTSQYYDFELIDYLKSHLTGVSTTVFASDEITSPNISCGILSVALLFVYLINLDIPIKNKLCYLCILGFFIFAFFNPGLDYILHAFHVPNDLPYRYSFLYSFVLVVISTYGLLNINKLKYPLVFVSYALIMVILAYISQDEWAGASTNMIYINMIILTLYFVFYSAYSYIKSMNALFYTAFILVAAIDVVVSINHNWDITQVLSTFYSDYEATEELLDYTEDYDDELFYRIENTTMMTLNDGSWYDYYGLTTFSSMAYESMAILQHNLGIPGNEINSYYYVQTTPIYDLMFDIKYFIGDSNDLNRYVPLKTIEETVNQFQYNVGLIFGVNKDIKNWDYQNGDPFTIQNDFISKTTGIQNVLKETTLLNTEELYNDNNTIILKYSFENPGDNLYFYTEDYGIDYFIIGDALYYNNDSYETTTSYSNELTYSYLESYDEKKIINIASGEETIDIYVAYNTFYPDSIKIYNIDHDLFENAYNKLNSHKLDMTEFHESMISGNITLDKDMTIYTSIPYDEGWTVFIDDKVVDTYKVGDSLLAFDADEGTHKITLRYNIPHLALGLTISSIGIVFLIINKYHGRQIKELLTKKKKLKN